MRRGVDRSIPPFGDAIRIFLSNALCGLWHFVHFDIYILQVCLAAGYRNECIYSTFSIALGWA